MMKPHLLQKIGFILLASIILSYYLFINSDVLVSLANSPYFAFAPWIVPLTGLFYLWTRLSKKSLNVSVWLIAVLVIGVAAGLINYQFNVLNVPGQNLIQNGMFFGINLLIHVLIALYILYSAWCSGQWIQSKNTDAQSFWIQFGVGLSLQAFIASLFAWMGWLNLPVVLLLTLVPIGLNYKQLAPSLKRLLKYQIKLDKGSWVQSLLLGVAITLLALILIPMIKPLAVGHDGNTLYFYLSRQIAESGSFISGHQPYALSLYYALPDILFGKHSYSLFLGHFIGLVGVAMAMSLLPSKIDRTYRYLLFTLMLSLPFLTFHFFMDEKIDLGLMTLLISAFILVRKILIEKDLDIILSKEKRLDPLWSLGLLMGVALSAKFTSFYFLLALIPIVLFFLQGRLMSLGLTLVLTAALLYLAPLKSLNSNVGSSHILSGSLVFLGGLGIMVWGILKEKEKVFNPAILRWLKLATLILPLLPWMMKNVSEHGEFSFSHLLTGKQQEPILTAPNPSTGENIAPSTLINRTKPKAVPVQNRRQQLETRSTEDDVFSQELQRYEGFETGFIKWLSLPSDIGLNANQPNIRASQLGFLFLLLLLGFIFFTKQNQAWRSIELSSILAGLIFMGMGIFTQWSQIIPAKSINASLWAEDNNLIQNILYLPAKLLLSFSNFLHDNSSLLNSGWMTEIGIVILVGVITVFYTRLYPRKASDLGLLKLTAFSTLLMWLVSGYGIVWYTIWIWPLLLVLAFSRLQSESNSWWKKSILWICLVQLVCNLSILSHSGFAEQPDQILFPKVHLDYSLKPLASEDAYLKDLNPTYRSALRRIESSAGNLYMINTSFDYFLSNMDGKIFKDDFLQSFDRIERQDGPYSNFYEIIKYSGFTHLLYDIRTPFKSGAQSKMVEARCKELLNYIESQPNITLVETDNVVRSNKEQVRLPNGQVVQGKYALEGQTINIGTFALFEVK